jgi:hypothetical protein
LNAVAPEYRKKWNAIKPITTEAVNVPPAMSHPHRNTGASSSWKWSLR